MGGEVGGATLRATVVLPLPAPLRTLIFDDPSTEDEPPPMDNLNSSSWSACCESVNGVKGLGLSAVDAGDEEGRVIAVIVVFVVVVEGGSFG